MSDTATLILAGLLFAAFAIATAAVLRGWTGWLQLKQAELARHIPVAGEERAELAELRTRVRKLEAIAACVDI